MRSIKMVDLTSQYLQIKREVDEAIQEVLLSSEFIQGRQVKEFEEDLSAFLGGTQVISCGNGTDALQIAMMALNFEPGDEVIVPVHTYVATAEVIALLKLVPVFVDVDEASFTLNIEHVERAITPRTVAVVPVHLYGQCADMESLLKIARRHQIYVVEDAAQALGARYTFSDGNSKSAGTIGTIGTTSFFPSKNLGGYGDGGAIFCNDSILASRLRSVANHGQREKYHHELVGVNSRLDTIQAAILRVKLRYLRQYEKKRRDVADFYDKHLGQLRFVRIPARMPYSSHVFHQYTIVTRGVSRDALRKYLQEKGIPSMIYYPVPLHWQKAYHQSGSYPITENLSSSVLSLPVHTEMDEEQLSYICEAIKSFQ